MSARPGVPVDDAEQIAWSGDGTLLAHRLLRRGAHRDVVVARAQRDYRAIVEHRPEAAGTDVVEQVTDELGKWLHAAGWARLGSVRELTC